jgi:hypothetical protein
MAAPTVTVEIAFNAGYLTAAASRTWTDVTAYVEAQQSISITRGRQDEISTIQASTLTLTLNNTDGRFTPEYAAGAYYPNVKLGRPIRVQAVPAGGGTTQTLFLGYVTDWPVDWPGGSQAQSRVTIAASSRMARLGLSAPFKSIIEEEILQDSPALYFPMGEPDNATEAGNVVPVRTERLSIVQAGSGGTLEFGQGTGPGTDDLSAPTFTRVDASNGKFLRTQPPSPLSTATGTISLAMSVFFNSTVTSGRANLMVLRPNTGGPILHLFLNDGKVCGEAANGISNVYPTTVVADGATHHAAVRAEISGTTVTCSVIVDQVATTGAGGTWPWTSGGVAFFPNFGALEVGGIGPLPDLGITVATGVFDGTLAHAAVWAQAGAAPTNARFTTHWHAGTDGFTSDSSDTRIDRYARLAGIPTAEIDTETGVTTSIAHQDTTGKTPISAMEQVAVAEAGVLFDGRDGVLTFHARSHRYNAASSFTLDVSAGDVEVGYAPSLDGQRVTNDVAASRPNGVEIRVSDQASITEYGYYRESIDLLLTSDNEVQSRADWHVSRFATPRVSVPAVSVDLGTCSASLIVSLLAADIGTRFAVTGLPSQAPASTGNYFIEGVTYDIGVGSFRVGFNTSPVLQTAAWVLDSSTYSVLDTTTIPAY